jgi:hypothetical protein
MLRKIGNATFANYVSLLQLVTVAPKEKQKIRVVQILQR